MYCLNLLLVEGEIYFYVATHTLPIKSAYQAGNIPARSSALHNPRIYSNMLSIIRMKPLTNLVATQEDAQLRVSTCRRRYPICDDVDFSLRKYQLKTKGI